MTTKTNTQHTPGPMLVGSRQNSKLIQFAWVPAIFWDDHSDRCPCDGDPEKAMCKEQERKGSRVLVYGTFEQFEVLRSDAKFYAGDNVDDCKSIQRSARATLAALAKAAEGAA